MAGAYNAIVIGASAGGITALGQLLPAFPPDYALPIVVVQHLHPLQENLWLLNCGYKTHLEVLEAQWGEKISRGCIYFAPPNYHLLIEDDFTFSLSIDARVNFVRPSIDVLFESAVDAYGEHLIGVILTGANADGARGLNLIKASGGLTVVQDPETADSPYMPRAALKVTEVDHVLSLPEIAQVLIDSV